MGAGTAPHNIQDLQSLLLHEEAVRLVKRQPELISSALDILEKWRASGSTNSRALLDEWSVILHRRDWRRVLARTRRSKELRQASPLTVLLPSEVRKRVLEEVSRLKRDVTLGHVGSAAPKPPRTFAEARQVTRGELEHLIRAAAEVTNE